MPERRPVALLFPGQGAQHPRMAAGLYGREPVFTDTMDTAFRMLGSSGQKIREEWLSQAPPPTYDDVTRAQPLLYAIGYALAATLLSWGVRPTALLGHSVGEMVAATVAGVLSFPEGIEVIRNRMEEFADTPPGGMLAVAAGATDIRPHIGDSVTVAAVNAPRQTLLAGEFPALDEAMFTLRRHGFTCQRVAARQAFHSPTVAEAAARSITAWQSVRLSAPSLPVYSCYLGEILPAHLATDPGFWAMQPVRTVLFWPALSRLLGDGGFLLVESGPGQSLTALARRHPVVASGRSSVISVLPARSRGTAADLAAMGSVADHLTAAGHAVSKKEFA